MSDDTSPAIPAAATIACAQWRLAGSTSLWRADDDESYALSLTTTPGRDRALLQLFSDAAWHRRPTVWAGWITHERPWAAALYVRFEGGEQRCIWLPGRSPAPPSTGRCDALLFPSLEAHDACLFERPDSSRAEVGAFLPGGPMTHVSGLAPPAAAVRDDGPPSHG